MLALVTASTTAGPLPALLFPGRVRKDATRALPALGAPLQLYLNCLILRGAKGARVPGRRGTTRARGPPLRRRDRLEGVGHGVLRVGARGVRGLSLQGCLGPGSAPSCPMVVSPVYCARILHRAACSFLALRLVISLSLEVEVLGLDKLSTLVLGMVLGDGRLALCS